MSFSDGVILTFTATFGAVVGSFLNVCIYRLPREGMTVSSPRRSHCPGCGFAIPWQQNLPILSWLFLGGHCRSCRAPISERYLLIEALTALAFAILAHRYLRGPEQDPAVFAVMLALSAACIVVAFIDQDLQIIPDEITLPSMMAIPPLMVLLPQLVEPASGAVMSFLVALRSPLETAGGLFPDALRQPGPLAAALAVSCALSAALGLFGYRLYWIAVHPREPKRLRDGALAAILAGSAGGALAAMALRPEWTFHPRIHALWEALAGMAAGSGLVLLVGILGKQIFRKEAMGFGDVKLMGLLGAFAGPVGVLGGFALACFLGSAVGIYRLIRYKSRYLPFGPYLVMGSLAVIVWPHGLRSLVAWYLSLF